MSRGLILPSSCRGISPISNPERLSTQVMTKNNVILNKKEKIIILKKSGIGSKIYDFAHKNAAAYGLFAIIFAILSGFLAATLFRRS